MSLNNSLFTETMKNNNIQFVLIILHQFHIMGLKWLSKKYLGIIGLLTICFCLQLSSIYAQNTTFHSSSKTSDDSNFTKLFDFDRSTTGSSPTELIKSGNYLYGVTLYGGPNKANGILYKIMTDGTEPQGIPFYDYYNPNSFTIIDTMVYGIVYDYDYFGLLYRVSNSGNGFEIIHYFDDVNYPEYIITAFDNTIYGTKYGILDGIGYLFKINPDGSGFQKFQSVGYFPYGKLILEDTYLYGTTAEVFGPADDHGTIYKIKLDGTEFSELHRFNSEQGRTPAESLTAVGYYLYGTTRWGGINDNGVIFRIKKDGTFFQVLHDFQEEDGAGSITKLVYSGKSLYGSTHIYGLYDHGTLFKINPDGTGFKKLYDLQGTDGSGPVDLIISNDTIFGITEKGGINDDGTIFRYIIDEPQITPVEPTKIFTLSITKPKEITLETKEEIIIDSGKFIDLDTTFSVEGNIPYTHSWNVKTGNDFKEINNKVIINQNITFYLFVTTDQGCTYTDSVTVQAKNVTSVEESVNNENQIIIYPNPNPGIFQIEILDGNANYEYNIFDISGRKVANGNIFCQTNECVQNIKLDNIKPGAYNLVIRKADKFYGQKKLVIYNVSQN
jgi:uncharacterized repeat protein (TIGR03803 family)